MKKAFTCGLFLISGSAMAEGTGWKSDAEIGFLLTSGNTETRSTDLKNKTVYDANKWRTSATLEYLQKEETNNDVTAESANRFLVKGKYDYKIIENVNYLFIGAQYEQDKFSGYEYRVNETIGYGHTLFSSNTTTLAAELGAGARQSELDANGSESEAVVSIAGNFEYKLSETASFTEEASVEGLIDSTVSKSVSAIKAQINSKISMKLAYTARYTDVVPAGIHKDDHEVSVKLVYNLM